MKALCAEDDDAFLDRLQHAAFDYFRETVNPANGLVPDTSREHSPVSIAVVGFALSVYPVAVERGWMSRERSGVPDARRRCVFSATAIRAARPRPPATRASTTTFSTSTAGEREWRSELSMIDTALLIAGVLTAAMYFTADTPEENALRELADALYHRVDWRWAQNGGDTIRQGWKPESGFLHYGWEGYSEAIVLYVLAMGSPTHPVGGDCYHAWTATYQWENLYGHDFLYAGPLFVHQFSHAWVDLQGIRDRFMREKDSDYFDNSRQAVRIQRRYTQLNPYEFIGYDENGWGLSAGDGPSDEQPDVSNEQRRLFGYAARGVPYGPDDGTLSAPAVLACVPFAPNLVFEAMRNILLRFPQTLVDGRLAGGFNPSVRQRRPALGVGRALRTGSGHRGDDDRKPSHRPGVAVDATLPLYPRRLASRRIRRRLA